jgi:phospholipase/carboxylesterase
VFPHAPQRAVTINQGYVMRAWYDILGTELVRREDEQGIHDSQAAVQALLDREVARGVPAGRLVLAGFSQGGAIALQAGLRQARPLAGIVALSTYLPLAATLAAERPAASASVPVFMAHGTADPIVPHERGTASRDALVALGQPVEWHEYPMAHSVNSDEIVAIARFLARVFAA